MLSIARTVVTAAVLVGTAVLTPAALAVPAAPGADPVAARAPAMVAGLWCGAGLLHNYVLEIVQEYQRIEARLIKRGRVHELTGHMDGPILRADPQRNQTMELLAENDELRIIAGSGILALAQGQFFTRAVGGSCTH